MMKLFNKKNSEVDQELKVLEMKLKDYLQPVSPRSEFISDLFLKILSSDFQIPRKFQPVPLSNKLLIAGGIVGSLLMLITSIRGLISLFGFVGLLIHYLQRNSRKQQTTPA